MAHLLDDQVDRTEESYDEYDSESEEIAAIINDGESDRTAYSDYVESDAEHYTFRFGKSEGSRGLPDLSDL